MATTTQTLPVFDPPPKVAVAHKRSRSTTIFSLSGLSQTLKSKSSSIQLPSFKPQQKQNESRHKYRGSISRPMSIDDAALRQAEHAARNSAAISMASPVASPLASPALVSPSKKAPSFPKGPWDTMPKSPPYATRTIWNKAPGSPVPQQRPHSPAPVLSMDSLRLYSPYDPRPAPEAVRAAPPVGLPPNPRAKGFSPVSGWQATMQQRPQQQRPQQQYQYHQVMPATTPTSMGARLPREDSETEIEEGSSCDEETTTSSPCHSASIISSLTSTPETGRSRRKKVPSPILVPVKMDSGWQLCDNESQSKGGRSLEDGLLVGSKGAWGGIAERRAASRAGALAL